jgi:hypothetical protein
MACVCDTYGVDGGCTCCWSVPCPGKRSLWVVAGIDVFVVKTGDIFRDPKVRAWIPVADGSHAF